jgi:hypothetical protein
MLKFVHVFEEEPRYSAFTVDILDDPPGARIEFQICEEGIWLSANSEGYLHLARIFAELGTRDFGEGTHFHMHQWLVNPANSKQEVSLEIYNGDGSENA